MKPLEITRPIVRYHGGKFMLADWIISHFPEHKGYTETFGGGGSILLKKRRSYFEVYNDLDGEIVNLFRVVRDHGPELLTAIELTPFSRIELELAYMLSDDPIEQARRSIYRSFAGFGSAAATGQATGFRANSNRSGTTPARDWRNYPNCIPAIIERLRGVIIENKDAFTIAKQHDGPKILHYFDPPYMPETRAKKWAMKSYRHEMTIEQHETLLTNIQDLKGYSIVSGYDSPLYNDMLTGWFKTSRAALADGALKRTEVLWISPNTPLKNSLF
jgi:DNA adenine methylase